MILYNRRYKTNNELFYKAGINVVNVGLMNTYKTK